MRNSSHNDFATLFKSYFALRKIVLNKKTVFDNIKNQIKVENLSVKISTLLRLDKDEKIFRSKSQNIYNVKQKIKRQKFDFLTIVQILMKKLNEKKINLSLWYK